MSAASDRRRKQLHDDLYAKVQDCYTACHLLCRAYAQPDMASNYIWNNMLQQLDQFERNMRFEFERDDT